MPMRRSCSTTASRAGGVRVRTYWASSTGGRARHPVVVAVAVDGGQRAAEEPVEQRAVVLHRLPQVLCRRLAGLAGGLDLAGAPVAVDDVGMVDGEHRLALVGVIGRVAAVAH